jgi:hypothetical protein
MQITQQSGYHQAELRETGGIPILTELLISFAPLEDVMRIDISRVVLVTVVLSAFPLAARAQAPAAPAAVPANANIVVESPTYTTIPLEIDVDRPAAEVWKRIGKYCDIGEWLQIPGGCKMLSGTEGAVGSVRSVASEVLVGKTDLSYTYTQTVRAGRPYNLYHGTLEARPVTDKTSKIVYTLMFDNSMLADDAAREKDKASKTATFTRAIQNMKILAEGGKLPAR